MKVQRLEARRTGGRNRRKNQNENSNIYKIVTYNDIQGVLEKAINDLITGKSTARQARAIGYLCKLAQDIQKIAQYEKLHKMG